MSAGTAAVIPTASQARRTPLIARIVCACDAFNAMVTDRSYRRGRSAEAALAEMDANRGTQFDPGVVDALRTVVGKSFS
jgi:HD-GYP domain-containing protein (c-di-GMP phosphodiesterase class II)